MKSGDVHCIDLLVNSKQAAVAAAHGEGLDGDQRRQVLAPAMEEFEVLSYESGREIGAAKGADFHIACKSVLQGFDDCCRGEPVGSLEVQFQIIKANRAVPISGSLQLSSELAGRIQRVRSN